MGRSRLAIIIPAHNESATIFDIVKKAKRYGEVLVIDDGSTDDTGTQAKKAGATVFRNSPALGYEGALDRGFKETLKKDFTALVTMDADGEHDPKYLKEFKEKLLVEGLDLCLGIRPRRQRFSESIYCAYVKMRYGPQDILCGMKGYNLDKMRKADVQNIGQLVGTLTPIKLLRDKAKLAEVVITGISRDDHPRYGSRIRANLRILGALFILIFGEN